MTRIRPMLATPVPEPFDRPGWVYEEKYDGERAIGVSRFQLLQRRALGQLSEPVFAVFDCLERGGESLLRSPLREQRAVLEEIVPERRARSCAHGDCPSMGSQHTERRRREAGRGSSARKVLRRMSPGVAREAG
jgi:ATP-dependent DNA ligase